jgi:hypothetical protein
MGIIAFLRSLIGRLLRAQEPLDPALLEEPPRRPRDEAFPAVLLPGEHHHDDPALYAGAEHHLSQEDDPACWDAGDDAAL